MLFQKSVLKATIQDESLIASRWANYQEFLKKIDFVKSVKEEKYQDGFLKDIFENSLGYTLDTTNPKEFNLEREKKNEGDSKKADGVICIDSKVVGVIELKAQDTKNLDKVQPQAFWYLTQHSDAKYVIISNFDELRFYFDKSTEYERFFLFNLSYEEFKKLHLILSYESIKDGLPLLLKEKSNSFEKDISARLYKDFSTFRANLFNNILQNNSDEKSELLRLTQKLCDRILFVLFAEDRGLLRANTIKEIREEFQSQKFTSYSLYDIYKFYFNAINCGDKRLDIPKYNGGLFAKDELLDSLVIDDEYLDVDAQKLSDYDFLSDVSVNILGHIFEQSLTELEEINALINHTEFDIKKTKRKKDGVFYTPEYITKYIVQNTLGSLCKSKRVELCVESEDLIPPKNYKKPTKKEKLQQSNLQAYREWLLGLKIIDPACGSGAFLNQALEFLIAEHKSLQKDLVVMGDITAYYEIEKSILENNLYGIDINEDAVEIAKLSLWLRTAQKGRELTKLADKIVCANSLLDEPFGSAKFDVVIGNPPYVNARTMDKNQRKDIAIKYPLLSGAYDLYLPFLLLGDNLLKTDGNYGWIIPNKILISDYAKNSLKYLADKSITKIINISKISVFDNVGVYPIIVLGVQNKTSEYKEYEIGKIEHLDNLENYQKRQNVFKRYKTFKDYKILINSGTTGFEAQKIKPLINDEKSGIKFIVSGTIDPYILLNKSVPYMKTTYKNPHIKYDADIIAKSKFDFWNKEKIIIAGMTKRIEAYYSKEAIALGVGIYGIYDFANFNPKYLLALLNSKFLTYYLNIEFKDKHLSGGYLAINKSTIEQLPLPQLPHTNLHKKNINYLLTMPKKAKYDKATKYAIASYEGREIYMSEFLMAKELGYIDKFQGHSELKEYMRLIPLVFSSNIFDSIYKNINDDRMIYAIDENSRKIFHVVDKDDFLVSVFVVSEVNFKKQLGRRFELVKNPNGGTATPHILSPARPFWRHLDLMEQLYHTLSKNSKDYEELLGGLADEMLGFNKELQHTKTLFLDELKLQKIPKKLQNFYELSFDEFVKEYKKAKKLRFKDKLQERDFKQQWQRMFESDKEDILSIKDKISKTDKKIDDIVYELYNLDEEEIKTIEEDI